MTLSSLYISNQPLTLTYFLIYEHITLHHELTQISIGGAPKDHNSAFSTSFNNFSSSFTHYRITHYYDIVPHVPEEFLGYEHVSDEIWYNEENTVFIICNDATGEDNSCSNSCSPTHCTSTSDHLDYLNVTMGSSSSSSSNLDSNIDDNIDDNLDGNIDV